MITLKINGKEVVVEKGTILLDVARSVGIEIPTMCYLKGYVHFTSCMVCVVKDLSSGKLIPACSAPVSEGMIIETDNEDVLHSRKSALDLLLSEHVGDCEAPCRITCPAHMNIPLMIRQIAAGKMREAIETVKQDIALPAVLGRICPAPCEKACRRSRFDASLAICLLKRFSADVDLSSKSVYVPECKPASGRSVAIIGAGPAGLAAAYYLSIAGHACTVFDDRAEPGGQLRYGVPENILPRSVLNKEIEDVRKLGVQFRMNTRVGKDIAMDQLRMEFDAIVLAPGKLDAHSLSSLGVEVSEKGIKADPYSLTTSDAKIFAGGEVVQAGHMAIRAAAHGKTMACSIDQYFGGKETRGCARRFESRTGKIFDEEVDEFMKEADRSAGIEPAGGADAGFSANEAVRESLRCMHCDCRKADNCLLRDYADEYQASPKHFNIESRKTFTRVVTHTSVIYESGKCIKCGLCVRITEKAHEKFGLAFIGRGYEAFVDVPFNESLGAGLQSTAEECVKHCPTGALAWKNC